MHKLIDRSEMSMIVGVGGLVQKFLELFIIFLISSIWEGLLC